MDKDNELELIETIHKKDEIIKQLNKENAICQLALLKACQEIMSRREIKDPATELVFFYLKIAQESLDKEEK